MTKMHSFGVDNQSFRLKILGWIALFTFIVVLQSQLLVDLLRASISSVLPLPKDVSPISLFTIIFTLTYLAYDRFLWKLNPFDKIPDLSGTWLGMASNPYFEPIRLELMQVEQHWTLICITVEVYEENESNPEDCSNAVIMGTEHSTIALITECERKYCDLTFNYLHNGEAIGQDSFEGVMFLKYKRRGKKGEVYELKGSYLNTKRGEYFNQEKQSEESFEGVIGRVIFRRVSPELIEIEEVLEKGKVINGKSSSIALSELKKEISSRIRGISKA
jgi:SMODS-associating 2TM, beta-strand rich effector domain